MKKAFFILVLMWTSFIHSEEEGSAPTGITYHFSGGRFGDNLLAYIHAKYISHIHHIPLLYKPFPFSDQLVMDKMERHWNEDEQSLYPKIEWFKKNEDVEKYQERNALYMLPYFPEFEGEYETLYNGPWFDMDWNAPGFIKELRKMIKPLSPMKKFPKKKGAVNVAVHVRMGSGHDSVEMTKMYFLKFPPLKYYEDQLFKVIKMYPNKAIYAYLFTDYKNPSQLAGGFAKTLRAFPITFGFRKEGNNLENVVLEDFFGMMQYDVIIRPEANLSNIAAKLGNFEVEIYPIHGYWSGDQKVIDQVEILDNRKRVKN